MRALPCAKSRNPPGILIPEDANQANFMAKHGEHLRALSQMQVKSM
jgi:hypothetical protein